MQNLLSMASRELKMKDPVVEESDSFVQIGFNEGKEETTEHYRALLRIYKEFNEGVKAKHVYEVEVEKLEAKIKVLNKLEKVYGLIKEKEKLEEELIPSQERLAEVKVPNPDWYKLGESWLENRSPF
ncbi:unnamed protein product [Eruca vesicaria subsp. sativa]|uniref:Uncharacterized protein n=1 Tax=Eruca vesicaria subsp. sativa TaxID=29727 RepID=A0ABC8IY33_ERUVS|nr:unnamed protein product [Eruca vesicaria subsp. sativa]